MAAHLGASLAEIALGVHARKDAEQTAQAVAELACTALGCEDAGVLLAHAAGRLEPVAATSERARQADQGQLRRAQGPALAALDEPGLVRARLDDDGRWPLWGADAVRLGLASTLSLRLPAGPRTVGVLTLYSPIVDGFNDEDAAVAQIFARHAGIALHTAREGEDLQRAMDSRKVIGQAQGILMERFAIDADRAFQVLLRYSQDNNVKLIRVAERIIATRRLPGD